METKKYQYQTGHRPSNPEEYPGEVATVDRIEEGIFFPPDILKKHREYFPPQEGMGNDAQLTANSLALCQGDPDAEVRIFRGAPSGGELNPGDWVTLSRRYAALYAEGGPYASEGAEVYAYTAKTRDISWDGDSIFEFGYWGPPLDASLARPVRAGAA